MRSLFVLMVMAVFLSACGGDGNGMVECLHPDALVKLNAPLAEIRESPEEAADFMAFMGIETTADEIRNIDAGGFISLMFKSPMFAGKLTGITFEVGAERVNGDVATADDDYTGKLRG